MARPTPDEQPVMMATFPKPVPSMVLRFSRGEEGL